jgi:hypothetical protein|tara:strand:- start:272 stop:499 length:228 start_codon:yes stop_codon:yes gene_type:complete
VEAQETDADKKLADFVRGSIVKDATAKELWVNGPRHAMVDIEPQIILRTRKFHCTAPQQATTVEQPALRLPSRRS